jgi:hypothetical protein
LGEQKFNGINIRRVSNNSRIGSEKPKEKNINTKKRTDKTQLMRGDNIIQSGASEQ